MRLVSRAGRCAALAAVAGLLGAAAARAEVGEPTAPAVVPGQIIVRFQPDVTAATARVVLQSVGATPIASADGDALWLGSLAETSREVVLGLLPRFATVAWADSNRTHPPAYLPDDPEVATQWHLRAVGAPAAWERSRGAGVRLAVLDTGVDPGHADLAAALVLPGWNALDGSDDARDVHGHGTRIAGVAAAVGGDGLLGAGVAPEARVEPVRVAGADGLATSFALAAGIARAVADGARVVNLSFGGVAESTAVVDAAARARAAGALVVAAAGNCGCDAGLPDEPAILFVGATDAADAPAPFSSRGAHVDLAAPGVDVRTTEAGGGLASGSGTSYAAPVVAGVAALLFAADPGLGPDAVEALLRDTARDVGAPGPDPASGAGRVDAAAALEALLGPLAACTDGVDNDGDGLVDFLEEGAACVWPGLSEQPDCHNGIDDDGDGRIDFPDDPQCRTADQFSEASGRCGLGFEAGAAVALLAACRRRRRGARRQG